MLFQIRRHGRLAQFLGDHALGIPLGVRRAASAAVLACVAALASMTAPSDVWAQQSTASSSSTAASFTTSATSSTGTPSVSQVSSGSAANTGAPANVDNDGDPVSRFLANKGLLPSAKPVVELAQQVRDRATDVASELVLSAMNFLGVPYRRGGNSEKSGFDCSGFTRHVFENSVGLILPRRASEQANSPDLIPVQKSELKPGDLVFFNTLRHTFSHVGIYIGDDKFIHSPRAGGQVRVEDMRQAYWQQRFDGARRAPSIAARQPGTPPANN